MRHATLRTVGCSAVLAAMFLGACGDDGASSREPVGDTTTSSTTTPEVADTTSTTRAPGGPTTVVPTTPPGTDLGTPRLGDGSSVSTTGLDTVRFGMTRTQAEQAAGTRLLPDDTIPTTVDCAVVVPESGPEGVSFTLSKGTVERVDIAAPARIRTRSGAGVSTPVTQLQTLFGDRLAVAPGTTTYVFTPVDPNDAAYRVIFETDGNAVTSFRSGRTEVTLPTVPCS